MAATRPRAAKPTKRCTPVRDASAALRTAIDRALDVDFVEEDQVDAYICTLNSVLIKVGASLIRSPEKELEVLWYFVEKIPSVFNSVHCEFELQLFCSTLVYSLLRTARRARADMYATATRLLDMAIADDFMQFSGVPEDIATARIPRTDGTRLATWATERAQSADRFWSEKLKLLSKVLLTGRVELFGEWLLRRKRRH